MGQDPIFGERYELFLSTWAEGIPAVGRGGAEDCQPVK